MAEEPIDLPNSPLKREPMTTVEFAVSMVAYWSQSILWCCIWHGFYETVPGYKALLEDFPYIYTSENWKRLVELSDEFVVRITYDYQFVPFLLSWLIILTVLMYYGLRNLVRIYSRLTLSIFLVGVPLVIWIVESRITISVRKQLLEAEPMLIELITIDRSWIPWV